MNEIPSTSTRANSPRLPKCLETLNKSDIIQIFLEMEDSQKKPIWTDSSFVEQEFFQKIELDGFYSFLTSTNSIKNIPLEALICAYSKAEQTFFADVEVIGCLYNDSRRGQIIPRNTANLSRIVAVDTILDTYFSALKKIPRLNTNKFERFVTREIIALTITSYQNQQSDIIDFLSKFYLDHANVYLSSFLIQAICCATYGLNDVLTSSINAFEESQNAEAISFSRKKKGAQFGTIVLSQDKNKHLNTLFVKAHQNYPYKGPWRYLHTSQSTNLSLINTFAKSYFLPPRPVDLKELFAYKVLEYTGFGPKTHFILNNHFEGFLYIATEAIEKFVTLGDFPNQYPELFKAVKTQFQVLGSQMMKDNFQITDQDPNNIILELTIFDLVARSMLLGDLNDGNIGFVVNPPKTITIKAVDFMLPITSKILDLNIQCIRRQCQKEKRTQLLTSLQNNPYIFCGVVNSFLDADTFTKYPANLLTGPFKPNFDDPSFFEYEETFQKNKKEIGASALKRLGKLDVAFTKAYEDICTFANGNADFLALRRGAIPDQNTEGQFQTKDPMTDLRQYKDAAIINFQQLSEFLTPSNCQ